MQGGDGEEIGVPTIHSGQKTLKLSCPIAINHANVIIIKSLLQRICQRMI